MGLWVVSKRKFDVVKVRLLLQNAVSRSIINSALIEEENGKTKLENALDYYDEKNISPIERIKLVPIFKVLDIISHAFNRNKSEFKQDLKDPTIRKVIPNSFRSLQKYGKDILLWLT